ncbi:MAG: branched-chain amino acid ABC transporter substrate-binding protein [Chloroflexi bacterium]|nr:branched-chain amino acid ABC transporter substrate-binding protein [Chloroflexota bacterium]
MNARISICFFVIPFIAVLAACQPAPTPAPQLTPTPEIKTPTGVRATTTPALPAIKIAVQAPLSGEQRDLGEAIRNGAQLAVKQFSKPIQDLGFNVVVVPFDDQARAETGVSNAKKLVADSEILVVIGHLNTPVALAALDTYKDANLALLSPASTDPKLTARALPIVSRVIGRDDLQGPAISPRVFCGNCARKVSKPISSRRKQLTVPILRGSPATTRSVFITRRRSGR